MTIYDPIATTPLAADNILVRPSHLPEVVHLDDPAINVMIDFNHSLPITIAAKQNIDYALNEMKVSGMHVLLVTNSEQQVIGAISTEDILGEKPIKLMQERFLHRTDILVRMVMTLQEKIVTLDFSNLKHARVANIVNTLKALKQQYALVTCQTAKQKQAVCSLFSASQISKQLHIDISNSLTEAQSLAELKRRQGH